MLRSEASHVDGKVVVPKHSAIVLPDKASTKPPAWLWHYTSRTGLLGIVGEGRLRATDLWYLNDAKEMLLTSELAIEVLDELASRRSMPKRDRAICQDLLSYADWLETPQEMYAFSLSERADALSQWRAYGQPGSSYALGFSTKLLRTAAKSNGLELCKCIYDTRTQRQLVHGLIMTVVHLLRPFGGQNDVSITPVDDKRRTGSRVRSDGYAIQFTGPNASAQFNIYMDFVLLLRRLGQYLKHPDFADEREWRLVLTTPEPSHAVQFGGKSSLLAPFVEIPCAPARADFGVRRVLIGPTPHSRLEWGAVHRLIAASSHPACTVENSRVPFRTW